MEEIFNQVLEFIRQGIDAVFTIVRTIWSWSVEQIGAVLDSPWQDWPLLKQILLLAIVGGVLWALYKGAKELWGAAQGALAAIAGLLGALVKTLPAVLLAGIIALGGAWLLKNINFEAIRLPSISQADAQ